MKKKLWIAAGILAALLVAAGVALWFYMNRPLYRVGMARALPNLQPPVQGPEPDFWTVEPGIRLYHHGSGTGPVILVVHGGPGYPLAEPIAALEPLAATHRVVYYHQRGAGKSSRPIDRFTSQNYLANLQQLDQALGLATQVADIERIRRILDEEKIVLLGHSFGAFLATLYAAEFPEHVKAPVLAAPASVLVMPIEEGNLLDQMKELLPPAERAGYEDFLKRYFNYGAIFGKSEADHRALNRELGEYYAKAAAARGMRLPAVDGPDNGGWMVPAMYFGMGHRHDYRPALKAVQAPALVLHGAGDIQPEAVSRTYAAAFPNASVKVIPNAGHFLFLDQPEAFGAAVSAFLARSDGNRR